VAPNAVDEWFEFGEHRPTLAFSSTVAASKHLVAEFISRGIPALHIDANTPDSERVSAINELEAGRLKVISVVNLFTRGTDIPILGCLLDNSPTLRLNRHIQKLGRGSRKNLLFKNCIVIDMAGNCLTLNHFYYEHELDLQTGIKFTKANIGQAMSVCAKCFRAAERFINGVCPYCGHENKAIRKAQEKKELVMKRQSPEYIENEVIVKFYNKEIWKRENLAAYRYKPYQKLAAKQKHLAMSREVHTIMRRKFSDEQMNRVAHRIALYSFNQ
jgi:superfamily II DNA or RNA helicase